MSRIVTSRLNLTHKAWGYKAPSSPQKKLGYSHSRSMVKMSSEIVQDWILSKEKDETEPRNTVQERYKIGTIKLLLRLSENN